MVHPATGYMLTRVLEDAPRLADAVYEGLDGGDAPRDVARAAWDAIWPAERRRRHALFRFGMETMLRMDTRRMQSFFAAFFSLSDPQWQGYLEDRLPSRELARLMARVLAAVPLRVRGTLVRSALGPPGAQLAASLLASSRS
jgi:lycopene beta-cyclase